MSIDPQIPLSGNPVQQPNLGAALQQFSALQDKRQANAATQALQAQKLEQEQKAQADIATYNDILRTNATPDGEVDLHGAAAGLTQAGMGDKVPELFTKWGDARKKQADAVNAEFVNAKNRIDLASQMVQGVVGSSDPEAAYQKIKSTLPNLVGQQAADLLGDHYNEATFNQVLMQGRSASENLAAHTQFIAEAKEKMDQTRQAVLDKQTMAEKMPALVQGWQTILSKPLALAKSQQDWDLALQGTKDLMGQMPPEQQAAVLAPFVGLGGYSPANAELARKGGLTPEQLSQEQDRQQSLAAMTQARADTEVEKKAFTQLSPEALNILAKKWVTTGELPSMGNAGAPQKVAIMNTGAALYPNLDPVDQQLAYTQARKNYADVSKQQALFQSQAGTAEKNLGVFLDKMKNIPSTFSPLLNGPLQDFSRSVAGNPDMAAYDTALQVVRPEFAKIMGGLGNQVTESMQEDVKKIMQGTASPQMMMETAKVLMQDKQNRDQTYNDQLSNYKKIIDAPPSSMGGGAGGGSEASWLPTKLADHPSAHVTLKGADGSTWTVTTDAQVNVISKAKVGG